MKKRTLTLIALIVILSMMTGTLTAAPAPTLQIDDATPQAGIKLFQAASEAADPAVYIVQLQDPSLASYAGGIAGLAATSPETTGARKLDAASPASKAYLGYLEAQQQQALNNAEALLGRSLEVSFQYLAVLNAFAVTLTSDEAAAIAKLPEVKTVWRDVERELDTDVGPIHIGAPAIWNGNTPGSQASRGEGVVIGVIDSGVNHAHPSFAATDGGGYTHTNPYGAGVYKGWCATNPSFCNAKLIAAYGLNPNGGNPEDNDGHGSHTASTAGGNAHTASFDVGPSHFDIPIQGVAPRANIVAYKVCNPGCPGSASIAAVNSAILNDQVDVINYSISGSDSPWTDPVDLAFLDASNAGIYVSASAGNDGPGASTVAKTGPWNAAVAASTINRIIANTVDVTGPTTPPALQGMPATPGENTSIVANVSGPIKYNAANNDGCTAFPANYFANSLALIQRGGCTFEAKVNNASAAGAIGVVIFNNVGGPPISMGGLTGTPPAFMLDLDDGTALRTYIIANPTAEARVNAAASYLVNSGWEDIVAGFSSRGPSQLELVKPDYIAPGVNILAATMAGATSPVQYEFMQGTSMSSPHSAGSAALMVGLYPTWTTAEIKSALASTATGGLVKEDGVTPTTPFDVGSGLLSLGGAANAGLVFNETYANYVAANPGAGGDPKTLNQPSMANYNCAGSCSWTRTAKAVQAGTWTASTTAPAGMTITVTPSSFTLAAGATQELTIQADVSGLPLNQFAFGSVTLTPNSQAIATTTLPVVVKPTDTAPAIDVTPASLAATQEPDTTTNQTLVIRNVGTAPLIWQIDEAPLAAPIQLALDGAAAPDAPNGPVSLVLDDGSRENGIGIGGSSQFIFLNRFTPSVGNFPITLNQVQVYFAAQDMVQVGDDMRLAIYENTSGNTNPAVGSNLLATFDVTVGALDAWNVYNLATPLTFNGPGDVLIGVIALEIPGSSYWPAAMDQTPPSKQRSWAGWWATPTAPGTPTLPPNGNWILIDSAGANFAGNWMVRGYGEGNNACDNPADVPWLTVSPTGATTLPGGSRNVTVGFDSTGLPLGTYNALLCVTSNDPDRPLVEVPVSLDVVELVEEPDIDVSPSSMTSTQPAGTTTTQTLNVGNTGGAELMWAITEEPSHAPELADWSDNFDSYATGSQLHGQGGWKGWGNDSGAGALTSSAQARSTPNSAAIVGATDLVHEYSETSGQWVYTAWQYIPTDFTGQSYFIMLNTYDDVGSDNNWSVQVRFDGTANQVVNDGGVSGGTLPLVRGQWVEIRVEIDLNTDTGAFYYNNQQLYSGTWSGQVSGGGALAIGAVDLFANNASVVYYDDMSLVGVTQTPTCSAPADIPWVSEVPTSGTTAAGDTTPVTVTFNSAGLAPGTYTGNLCIDSDDPDPGPGNGTDLVVVPVTLTVEQAQQVPNIDVDPLSMSSTQPADTITQQTLTIANTGAVTLTWNIDEEDTTAFPPIVAGPQVAQPATENVGAPVEAAPAAAPAPAAIWHAPTAVLYNNGPLVTNPGAGAGGADASALQTALGNSTYGFGHAVSSGYRMADDFTVPAGGWTIDQITFFAYQTGSTTTSTINAVNLRIWDGPPGVGNVVFGDTTTNRMTSTAFSNIYRVLDTGLGDAARPIMANVAAVGLYLPAGTYWVDWQTGGTLSSGPWAPPVTIAGQTQKPGANGLQWDPTASAWNAAMDTGSNTQQDLPFIIEGTAGEPECLAPSDIPWLSLSAYTGANAGGTSTNVTATFNSNGLAVGTYTGNLCINSNDPDAGPGNGTELVIVPVTLIVEESNAVTMSGLSATAGLPLATLPIAASLALGALYALRRRKG